MDSEILIVFFLAIFPEIVIGAKTCATADAGRLI